VHASDDDLDRVNRRIVTLLTVGIWIGIFIAGLWPFNFIPNNGVRWLPAGLHFDGYGQVYSSAPMVLLGDAKGFRSATVEIVFTPAQSYQTASTFFSLVKKDDPSFGIGQSVTDLFVEGSFIGPHGELVPKLWIDHVCDQGKELFVTVTLSSQHVDVYIDGRPAISFSGTTHSGNISGNIIVGHSPNSGERWNGTVARVAILPGAFDASEIGVRYEQWIRTRHLDRDVNHEGAAYEFVTPTVGFVRNIGEIGPYLTVPKTFRSFKPTVLEWPDRLNRSVVIDAIINVAGFIPFGLGTCVCLRLWTRWNISRCIAMTILAGASVSLGIELLQVLLPTRDSSLADLVTNIMGATIGAGTTIIGK